jgi:hypothetical protein
MASGDAGGFFDCFPFLIFAGFAGFAIMVSVLQRRRVDESLKALATEMGCETFPGGMWMPLGLRGQYRGRDIEVRFITEGHGKSSRNYTIIEAGHSAQLPSDIWLWPENFGTKIEKMFGSQDLTVGVEEFDKAYMIQAKAPEAVHSLNFEVQAKLLAAKRAYKIGGKRVIVKLDEWWGKKEELKKLIDEISDVAEALGRT